MNYRNVISEGRPWQSWILWLGAAVVAILLAVGGFFFGKELFQGTPEVPDQTTNEDPSVTLPNQVVLPKNRWNTGHIRIEQAQLGTMQKTKWVTGKLTVNEDRTVHVFPLVSGRVQDVKVRFGEDVEAGQVLAVVASRELAEAKLTLFQNRLETQIAKVNYERTVLINNNTQGLIQVLRKELPINEIEQQFHGKSMGDFRKNLISAYANLYKARVDHDRLTSLTNTVPGKEIVKAKAILDAGRATFQAALEQTQFTANSDALIASQSWEKAKAQEAITRTKLQILGCSEKELNELDPAKQGAAISHYPVKAPFAATVVAKDATMDEKVTPDSQMFQLADLSVLWLEADIYQRDLPLLQTMPHTEIRFRLPYSKQISTGTVFYHGDLLDPQTRAAQMLASVPNPDRTLKPGMFVEVELPGQILSDVVRVPTSAVVETEGKKFVFVHLPDVAGGETFERRFVRVGETASGTVHIIDGLTAGEPVAVEGTFALKTELMKDQLLAEGE